MSLTGSVRGVGTGRGFLGDGCSTLGLGGGGVGFAAGLGGGLTAGLGFSLTIGTVFASCCCLSLCFNHGGLLSSSAEETEVSFWLVPFGTGTCGFEGTAGGVRGLVTVGSESSVAALRFTQGGGALSSVSSPVAIFSGGGAFVLRSWLAQGATWAFSSSFFSPIFVSRFIIAELLPDLSRAFFIISEISIPPPPPPFAFVCGGGFKGLPCLSSVVALTCFTGFWGLFGGRVCVFDVSVVPGERLGRGGPAAA